MPTLEHIIDTYELTEHGTGGNCMAHFHELNTNQDYVLIADEYSLLTENYAQNITIVVFLHDQHSEGITFQADNLDQLDSILHNIYELWGY